MGTRPNASISTTLSEKEVTGYGLNGRNFSQLITMAPGGFTFGTECPIGHIFDNGFGAQATGLSRAG